jgi:probable rRNA maturation factor
MSPSVLVEFSQKQRNPLIRTKEMIPAMDILLDTQYNPQGFDPAHIDALARFALDRLDVPDASEVSITFVPNDEIAELNEQYRGKVGPTDVLSFECDNLDDDFDDDFPPAPEIASTSTPDIGEGAQPNVPPSPIYSLGDIIIAPDVVAAQAPTYGNTPAAELELMVVHGLLHLNGYDHIEDDEAAEMEALQTEILKAWRESAGEGVCADG